MKVCHITTAHRALDTRIFYKEAKSLANAGYKVYLVGQHHRREILDGVEIVPLNPSQNRFLRILFKPIKALYLSVSTGSKIYHIHDPELMPAGLILKLFGKKVIYDAHEDYPQLIMVKDWIPGFAKNILSYTTQLFENICSRFYDMTCAPSAPLSRRLPKGIALYNYPSEHIYTLLKESCLPYNERDIDVIHVGVLRKVRLDFFIDVLRELKKSHSSIKSVFVGLTKEQIDYVRSELGNMSNVKLMEKVPFTEIVKLVGRSKIGVNYHPNEPHLKYAVPVKVFEYMGAGCVVVTSDFPFLKEILGDNSPVFFRDHEPVKFAGAIMELIDNPMEIESLGKLSQEYSQKFSWEREEINLIKAYARIS